MKIRIEIPEGLYMDSADLVTRFAEAMAAKLLRSQEKYGYTNGWLSGDWREECQRDMAVHIDKGDPIDVAIYAAFMWHHGWSTANNTEITNGKPKKKLNHAKGRLSKAHSRRNT